MRRDKFYITTPIYYVNDRPHIGHAYTTILADVLARYHRLMGIPTFFLTGTDEHGQKVERAAREAGITPQEQADRTVVRFRELWKRLQITNDDFIRTTEQRHKRVVQALLQKLFDKGEIYEGEYDGWYCTPCERFFTEKDLVEGNCPECHRPVERIKEKNYFFRMSRYQDWLIRYIEEHPGFIRPDFRRNETLGFLAKSLGDLCISRPRQRLSWGIDLPFDKDYVTYVWFDALVNYISAAGYRFEPAKFERWWPAIHLIGKDILTTHSVYWPTMLRAAGVDMPEMIFAHGWWLVGESKMSKSLGNVVNPMDMIEKYGVDAFRYYLIVEMILGQDASFTEEAFIRRYNTDLANDLGNALSRVLGMTRRYLAGTLPNPSLVALERSEDQAVWEECQKAVEGIERCLEEMRLDSGVAGVASAVRAVNRYLEHQKPWELRKRGDSARIRQVLYTAGECLRVCAGLLQPVMPSKMAALRGVLGLAGGAPEWRDLRQWGKLPGGSLPGTGMILFPRIERSGAVEPAATEARERGVEQAENRKATDRRKMRQNVSFEEFSRLDLRTAKILNAEKVSGTQKLLRLEVLVGDQRRQLVAGIAEHYRPGELVGKTIVIVANLEPARIRGIESQGMLLAASKGERLRLVTVDGEITSGAVVK